MQRTDFSPWLLRPGLAVGRLPSLPEAMDYSGSIAATNDIHCTLGLHETGVSTVAETRSRGSRLTATCRASYVATDTT